MCSRFVLSCALASLATGASALPRGGPAALAAGERAALADLALPELAELRAGAAPAVELPGADREILRELEQRAPELAAQRAGDISNQELTTIFLILGIVAALVIIL